MKNVLTLILLQTSMEEPFRGSTEHDPGQSAANQEALSEGDSMKNSTEDERAKVLEKRRFECISQE